MGWIFLLFFKRFFRKTHRIGKKDVKICHLMVPSSIAAVENPSLHHGSLHSHSSSDTKNSTWGRRACTAIEFLCFLLQLPYGLLLPRDTVLDFQDETLNVFLQSLFCWGFLKIEIFRSLWVDFLLSVLTFTSTWALFHLHLGYSIVLIGWDPLLPGATICSTQTRSFLSPSPSLPQLEDSSLREGLELW